PGKKERREQAPYPERTHFRLKRIARVFTTGTSIPASQRRNEYCVHGTAFALCVPPKRTSIHAQDISGGSRGRARGAGSRTIEAGVVACPRHHRHNAVHTATKKLGKINTNTERLPIRDTTTVERDVLAKKSRSLHPKRGEN
ncbi:unnamed protein product, partial [Ectocarpus sp. 8 AP-2014]